MDRLTVNNTVMRLFSEPVLDILGKPLDNGRVYLQKGDKMITAYSSAEADTPLPSPVLLDSKGWAEIWVKDMPVDVLIYDAYNRIHSITTNVGA